MVILLYLSFYLFSQAECWQGIAVSTLRHALFTCDSSIGALPVGHDQVTVNLITIKVLE